jgi:hypothetical protein
MKRLLLAAAVGLLGACAAPTQPQTSMQPAVAPTPPRILHRLVLASPPGQGSLELRREGDVYRAYGGIVAADDVGQWRFAYTKTSLEGVGPTAGEWIDGLHALAVVLVNTSRGDVQIDWDQSTFEDPSGRTHRMIHRGVQLNQLSAPMVPSVVAAGATLNEFVFPAGGATFSSPGGRASLWNAPAVFERLTPGAGFSIVFTVRTADAVGTRTFKFSAVPPPPA